MARPARPRTSRCSKRLPLIEDLQTELERNRERRELKWSNIDFDKRVLTVGKSKTAAGEGRTIPILDEVLSALVEHAKWYTAKFGTVKPEWYVSPGWVGKSTLGGEKRPYDPTKRVTSPKTALLQLGQRQ